MDNYTPGCDPVDTVSLLVDHLDVRVRRKMIHTKTKVGGGMRGEIKILSNASRSRLIWTARNTPGLHSILTLTYPHEDYAITANGGNFMADGRTIKEHLRKFRQQLTYRGLVGFWFLEFQKRGAPHFHFFLVGTLKPQDVDKLRDNWARIVGSSCPHHPTRGLDYQELRKPEAAGAYAAKYSSKDEQKVVPEHFRGVGRFWGFFGKLERRETTIKLGVKELFELARVAKRYARARARSEGYKLRGFGSGFQGFAAYYAAPILRAYLAHHYIIPDSWTHKIAIAPRSLHPASASPL